MRTLVISTALALGLATSAFAQAPAASAAPTENRGEQRMARHLDRLATELNLTAAQKLQVEAIMAEQHAARRAMHERFRTEREALKADTDGKLAQVLTAEQQAQLEQLRAERRQRWQERRGRGGHHGHGDKRG
jgi:Spy/CpxP family protein refolding chaperone